MDRELLRIIIFTIGLLVIIVMIAWSYLQHEKANQSFNDYEDTHTTNDDLSSSNTVDDFDIDPTHQTDVENAQVQANTPPPNALKKPTIIQFSLLAPTPTGFNGMDLVQVLDDAGLEYGNLQIFERLDARRLVDFGVANMVKPGIFPSTNLAAFYSPGIVFFMQPSKVDDPVKVFDDFVEVFTFVAHHLGGQMRDQQREPLTDETIMLLRESLLA